MRSGCVAHPWEVLAMCRTWPLVFLAALVFVPLETAAGRADGPGGPGGTLAVAAAGAAPVLANTATGEAWLLARGARPEQARWVPVPPPGPHTTQLRAHLADLQERLGPAHPELEAARRRLAQAEAAPAPAA